MPDTTPILQLPYILPAQAQKHVPHNEAIRVLDVIVQLSVTARNLPAPPASPAQGDRYVVAVAATGDWAGQSGKIALFENGAWQFFAPISGWTAWVTSEQVLATFTGSAWTSQADGPFNVGQLGVSATPDATNRLSVSSAATLLNHAGAGHQLKVNKSAQASTASLVFQTDFSGRAEMGTMGSDDFAIKVSADGSAFVTGLSIAAGTGQVTLPAAARLGGQAVDPVAPPDGTIWLNTTTGEVKLRSAGATIVLASSALGLPDGDKGDLTVTSGGTVWEIDAGVVSNSKLAPMPNATFKARLSAGTGAPEDIGAADVAALLPQFSAAEKGVVPASGGGTTNYLRADGTWAAPTGGAGSEIMPLAVRAHRSLLGSAGWNFAAGNEDFTNPTFWTAAPVTNAGVTVTQAGTGIDADGISYADFAVTGSATATSFIDVYGSISSAIAASSGQTYTSSMRARRVAGVAPPAGCGVRCEVREVPSLAASTSSMFSGDTLTTLNATRTISVSGTTSARAAVIIRTENGATVNYTLRVSGLQFERSAARSNGRVRELTRAEAQAAVGVGTNAGDIAVLGAGGRIDAARLPIATQAQAEAGTVTTVTVTPLGVRQALRAEGAAPIYSARAWVNFNGTGIAAIRAAGNVSSITDNGNGDYTINFTTALPDANYAVAAMGSAVGTDGRNILEAFTARTASNIRIVVGNAAQTATDGTHVSIVIFR
jgi:hypothetical protein